MSATILKTLSRSPAALAKASSISGPTQYGNDLHCVPSRTADTPASPTRLATLLVTSVLAGALIAGCASGKQTLILDPVGPPPAPAKAARTNGTLVVFSAFDIHAHFTSIDPDRFEHTDYTILSENGALLRKVYNDSNTVLEGPVAVGLPPGNYRIVARASGYGLVTVPVIIVASRVTTVHLEGGAPRFSKSAVSQTNLVRLPGGQVVGWRAGPGTTPNP